MSCDIVMWDKSDMKKKKIDGGLDESVMKTKEKKKQQK